MSTEPLLQVTMTADAARRFKDALYHASARVRDEEHAEMLIWGANRVTLAERRQGLALEHHNPNCGGNCGGRCS